MLKKAKPSNLYAHVKPKVKTGIKLRKSIRCKSAEAHNKSEVKDELDQIVNTEE